MKIIKITICLTRAVRRVCNVFIPLNDKCCIYIYYICQISMEAIWSVVGLVDTNLSESDTTDSADSPQHETNKLSLGVSPMETRERSLALSGLDIHSCLQFLQELYGPWMACDGTTKPPLMLLNAAVRSVSEVFSS